MPMTHAESSLQKKHLFLELLMKVVLRPVFGWRDPDAQDFESVRVIGRDGSELSVGVSMSERTGIKGVVLLCHPFLKYGKRYFWRHGYPAWLNAAGYHVVAFDFKGFGTSRLAGIAFPDDIDAVADWALGRFPGLPLHLFGVSFGAYQSIHALAKDWRRFGCAVFDSVPARLAKLFSRGWTGYVLRSVSTSRWGPLTGANTIFDSLPAIRDLPCLFLYGRQDEFISTEEVERIALLCPGASVKVFDDCGHLGIRKHHPADYMGTVIHFMDTHADGSGLALKEQA